MNHQQTPRKWTAHVKRPPIKDGDWYEEYVGNGEYRWKQYHVPELVQ